MEEMIRYLAETQRLMAENITKLTEVQQSQQQLLERHDAEIIESRQKQAENDQRFNVLLEEVRYLIRNLDRGDDNGTN